MQPKGKHKQERDSDDESPHDRAAVSMTVGKHGNDEFWDASYPRTESSGPITFSGHVNPAWRRRAWSIGNSDLPPEDTADDSGRDATRLEQEPQEHGASMGVTSGQSSNTPTALRTTQTLPALGSIVSSPRTPSPLSARRNNRPIRPTRGGTARLGGSRLPPSRLNPSHSWLSSALHQSSGVALEGMVGSPNQTSESELPLMDMNDQQPSDGRSMHEDPAVDSQRRSDVSPAQERQNRQQQSGGRSGRQESEGGPDRPIAIMSSQQHSGGLLTSGEDSQRSSDASFPQQRQDGQQRSDGRSVDADRPTPEQDAHDSVYVQYDAETQAEDIDDRLGDSLQLYQPMGNNQRYLYRFALQQGCVAVAALAYVQATRMGSSVITGTAESEFRLLCCYILWSMPRLIIECLVEGNLAVTARGDLLDLFDEDSEWMQESMMDAPVIYVLVLVDREGRSPKVPQLRAMIQLLRKYVLFRPEDVDFVTKVDNALGAGRSSRRQSEQGLHIFLHKTKQGQRIRVKGRQEIVEQFCDALEKRLDALVRAGEGLIPLERPLTYVGYALRFATRMSKHDHGESSFLMQLVRSVCRVQLGAKFNLEPYPVCFIADADEARLAELLITQLADSFSWTGGGFNIHPPGINNASADLSGWTNEAAKQFWKDRAVFRREQGHTQANRRLEQQDLEERARAIEAPQAGLTGSLPPSQGYYGLQYENLQSGAEMRRRREDELHTFRANIRRAVREQMSQATLVVDAAATLGHDPATLDELRESILEVEDMVRDEDEELTEDLAPSEDDESAVMDYSSD